MKDVVIIEIFCKLDTNTLIFDFFLRILKYIRPTATVIVYTFLTLFTIAPRRRNK